MTTKKKESTETRSGIFYSDVELKEFRKRLFVCDVRSLTWIPLQSNRLIKASWIHDRSLQFKHLKFPSWDSRDGNFDILISKTSSIFMASNIKKLFLHWLSFLLHFLFEKSKLNFELQSDIIRVRIGNFWGSCMINVSKLHKYFLWNFILFVEIYFNCDCFECPDYVLKIFLCV